MMRLEPFFLIVRYGGSKGTAVQYWTILKESHRADMFSDSAVLPKARHLQDDDSAVFRAVPIDVGKSLAMVRTAVRPALQEDELPVAQLLLSNVIS